MQSLASLMSVKPTDIGNLDDFNESDEEEDKRSSTGINLNTAVSGITKKTYVCLLYNGTKSLTFFNYMVLKLNSVIKLFVRIKELLSDI